MLSWIEVNFQAQSSESPIFPMLARNLTSKAILMVNVLTQI